MFCRFFLIIIVILRLIAAPTGVQPAETRDDPTLEAALSFLSENLTDSGVGSEWSVMALAAGGRADDSLRSAYIDAIAAQVAEKLSDGGDVPGALDRHKATENARVILALRSLGADASNVGGHDLTDALTNVEWVCASTLNSPIFALIALNACGSDDADAKESLVSYILEKQLADGGWALSGDKADPDVTAMALDALAFHRNEPRVVEAADKALDALSEMQLDSGEYRSWGTVNSESLSQVVIALAAWDVDPANDARFTKNGVSALDALRAYADESGGFLDVHADEDCPGAGEVNIMATEQAALALAAYAKFESGSGMLYAFGE